MLGCGLLVLGWAAAGCGVRITVGTPFRGIWMKYGTDDGKGVLVTEKFLIIYDGMPDTGRWPGTGRASCYFTYAGTQCTVPDLRSGYGSGRDQGSRGIEFLSTYEPRWGVATIFFLGKIIQIENEGTLLRVQNAEIKLGEGFVVAVVSKDGFCTQLTGEDARKAAESVPSWYRDGQFPGRPAVFSSPAPAKGK
jgi:hypothetical protein